MASGGPPAAGPGGGAKKPVDRAEQLFASLTAQAEERRQAALSSPMPDATNEVAAERNGPAAEEIQRLTDPEVHDLLLAARAAVRRIADAVRAIRSDLNATNADLATLGEAIAEALAATNERIGSVERVLLGEAPHDAEAAVRADRAVGRLRRTLRDTRREGESESRTKAPKP